MDPDEYVLENGKDKLQEFIATQGRSAVEFLVENAVKEKGLKATDSKAKITADIIPFIDKVKNAVTRHEWIKFLSDKLRTSEEAIGQEIKRQQKGRFSGSGEKAVKILVENRSVEEEILQLMTNLPECRNLVSEDIFKNERNRKVCSMLLKNMHTAEILSSLDEGEARWFSELIIDDKNYNSPEQVLAGLIKDHKQNGLEVERKELEKEVVLMLEGNIPVDNNKMQLYHDLNRQLKGSTK
jgi:DNA primase